jgi:hypothetical protein
LGLRWFYSKVLLNHRRLFTLHCDLVLGYFLYLLSGRYSVYAMPVVSMIRVRRVEERELGILTLILANLVLELRGVGRARDEEGSSVNDRFDFWGRENEATRES